MRKKLTKRQAKRARNLAVEKRQGPAPDIVRPPEPWILFGKVTPSGYAMIEQCLAEGELPNMPAVLLGMTEKEFFKLARADRRVQFALESGEAKMTNALLRMLHRRAITMLDSEAAKFRLRVAGMRESGPLIEINNDNRRIGLIPAGTPDDLVQEMMRDAAERGQLLLPAARKTREEEYALRGMDGPDDARTMKDVTPPKTEEDKNAE